MIETDNVINEDVRRLNKNMQTEERTSPRYVSPMPSGIFGLFKTGIFSLPRYSRSIDREICLPIGAISGHFQLHYGPGRPNGQKNGRFPTY